MIKDGDIRFPFTNVMRIFPEHFDVSGARGNMSRDEQDYERSPESFAACCGCNPRAVEKWRQKGYVNAQIADLIAISNDLHPTTVWPVEWQEYLDRAEDKQGAE